MASDHYSIEIKDFFKSAFSVDCVVFGFDDSQLKVLLIKRGADPYLGFHALPGDLVYPDENLDGAAGRVLKELTGLEDVYLEQVNTFGAVDRHPLGRVITIAYFSLLKTSDYKVDPSSWAADANWFALDHLPQLAFDHRKILESCRTRLQENVRRQPIGFELLPKKFTLREMQDLYESLLGKELDTRNFRKKVLAMDLLTELKERQEGVAHRPAKLYKFEKRMYKKLKTKGFNFDM
jgi:8-oxo-dGTP diphosphatase